MAHQRRLEDKAAVITGANRGIGRAIAEAFSAQGAHLFLVDRDTTNCGAIAEAAQAHGIRAFHGQADVTDPAAVEATMERAEAELGRIDILVNCAGIFQSFKFLDYDLKDWNHLMNINVNGTFLCCQSALRRMVPRRQGKVVNLASVAGRVGRPYLAAYNASKHAVIGLTRSVAMEMAEHGINVNAICPGMVDTDMFDGLLEDMGREMGVSDPEALRQTMLKRAPLGRMIRADEVAKLAVYLASPESDAMTGQAVTLSGGMLQA